MPIYDFECKECAEKFEVILPLDDYKRPQTCPLCDAEAIKIMTLGGIQDDHPVWLDGKIIRQLQDTDDPNTRPIANRGEYNKYLKDNGLQPNC